MGRRILSTNRWILTGNCYNINLKWFLSIEYVDLHSERTSLDACRQWLFCPLNCCLFQKSPITLKITSHYVRHFRMSCGMMPTFSSRFGAETNLFIHVDVSATSDIRESYQRTTGVRRVPANNRCGFPRVTQIAVNRFTSSIRAIQLGHTYQCNGASFAAQDATSSSWTVLHQTVTRRAYAVSGEYLCFELHVTGTSWQVPMWLKWFYIEIKLKLSNQRRTDSP